MDKYEVLEVRHEIFRHNFSCIYRFIYFRYNAKKKIIKQQKQIIKNDKTEEKGICTSFHVPPLLAIA